jgi:nitrogen fixation protein FixH
MSATETKARSTNWRWPSIIVGMLGVHVLIMVIAVTLATRDPGFSVVPDYYQRAVHWDQEQALKKSSAELGWQIKMMPSEVVDPVGRRQVSFELVDRTGAPISGAALEVIYFHHAHGHESRDVKLMQNAPGRYSQSLDMRYEGFWEFHFTATVNGKTFIQSATQWVANAHTTKGTAS